MTAIAHEALYQRLRARSAQTLALTERLVRVNSHTKNLQGVDRVGALLKEALEGCPLTLETRPQTLFGEHLCFSTRATARSILLVGHHDTVFPVGSFEGFRREGDLAYGPGVLDMKGGLAIVVSVLQTLGEADLLERIPLRFVSVSDEEVGSPTSQPWLQELARDARCALVFEAGRAGDAIITARRGSGSARLTAHGKAAHAGNALADGKNAIWALSRAIDSAQQLNGTIGGASLNVGLVQGGSARNTVPDRAEAELDLRFSDAAGESALRAALDRIVETQGVEGTRLELAFTVARSPWARSDAAGALSARYGACQRAAGLDASEAKLIGGGSDANTVGALGVPTIDGLGPRGHGFHTPDEQIQISSLALKAEALLRFLLAESALP